MRKLIGFGAGFVVAEFIFYLLFGVIVPILFSPGGGNVGRGVGIAVSIVTVGIGAGYFLLMKKLGAWNESAWYAMGNGRKTALFLLALPGIIGGIEFIIILAIFVVFAGKAGESLQKSARRAQFRADVESAVHDELNRHGF